MNTETSIDRTAGAQLRAARTAALAFLLGLPLVVYTNYAIHEPLINGAHRSQAAQNILAAQGLFRVGIGLDVLYCVGLVVMAAALHVVLRPVSAGLALAATILRLVYAAMWLLISLDLLAAVRMATGAGSIALAPDRMQELVRLAISLGWDQYYVGLVFWGLASTLCAVLWLRSHYLPRWLAGYGLLVSGWSTACGLVYLVQPRFRDVVDPYWYDGLLALFELLVSVWLLARGLRTAPAAK